MVAALAGLAATLAQPADSVLPLGPTRYELDLTVDIGRRELRGSAAITIRNVSPGPVREVSLLMYRLMRASSVRDSVGASVPFTQQVVEFEDHATLQVRRVLVSLPAPLPRGRSMLLRVDYGGALLGYAETGMRYIQDRIDSNFSIVRDDAFAYPAVGLPSHAVQRRTGPRRYDYVARITVPAGYVVANGGRLERVRAGDGWSTYEFTNVKPAWRMDFAVARFGVRESGDLRVYYLPEDSAGAARVLDAMTRTLALYTRWFGALSGPSHFALIEIPDGWGSQADVSSILQAAAAFRDPRRQYELYHELSHLWNVTDTDAPSPRWNEGLATFLEDITTDSLEARATTDAQADEIVVRLREAVRRDDRLTQIPPVDYGRAGMTGRAYSVGAVMFYIMYRLMGHDAFTRLIAEHHRRYRASGGSTREFGELAKELSPLPLDRVLDDWLFSANWARVIAQTQATELPARYRPATPIR